MLKPYATICGITEEEMLTQMSGHIDQMAQALGCTREETIAKLKQRYDGYHFTWPSPDIYNPFSLTIAEYVVIPNQPSIGHTKLVQPFDSPLKLFSHSKFGVVPAMNHEVDVVTSVGMAHEGLRLVMGPLSVANEEETERVLLLTCRLDTGDLGCIDPFGQTAVKPPIVGMIVDEVATDQPSAKEYYFERITHTICMILCQNESDIHIQLVEHKFLLHYLSLYESKLTQIGAKIACAIGWSVFRKFSYIMNGYLLDTCICVFLFRNKFNVKDKLNEIGCSNCYISDVTLAELKFGAYKSNQCERNLFIIKEFIFEIGIVPFIEGIDIYSQDKAMLHRKGTPIEDFDLLIASAAKARNLTLVTDNIKHFKGIDNLMIENWVIR